MSLRPWAMPKISVGPQRQFGLPKVYGPVETAVVTPYIAAHMSGALMEVLTLDPSMVPFTALAATQFIRVMNAVLGGKPGLTEIRKRCITCMREDRLRLPM
mmetsp:Transcript_86542/g.166579  ORF Transcript_86542/g.166579 Transcript_86542/m.166579 type:complete len:101 (+) Transcript_86542:232-534(+)